MCFIGVLLIIWLPLALPIYFLLSHDANLTTIVTMSLLFMELLFSWHFWGKLVHQEKQIFRCYGLELSQRNLYELLQGLAIGFWLCLSLFIIEAICGWVEIEPIASNLFINIVLEGLISALGIALAEELLFRGWLLDELQRDYRPATTIWIGSIIFALAHFIKPIEEIMRTAITFPALMLLGISLILAKQKYGDRLGICIGIHAGLVWGYYIVNVGNLIKYTNQVPAWVTGIDHNPIAGVMGLLFLTGLLGLMINPRKRLI